MSHIALLNHAKKTFSVASFATKDEAEAALNRFLTSGSVEGFNRFASIYDLEKFLSSTVKAGYSRK